MTYHLIIFFPDAPKCPEELLDGVLWSPTAAGGTDVKPCPNGASGKSKKKMRFMCCLHTWYCYAASSLILVRKNGVICKRLLYRTSIPRKCFLEFCWTDKNQVMLFVTCFSLVLLFGYLDFLLSLFYRFKPLLFS